MNKIPVKFKRGTELELSAMPVVDGQLLYNVDTAETFMDIDNKRLSTNSVVVFKPVPSSTAKQNSELLQKLIDAVSARKGGTIYIPAGTYEFASNGQAREIDYCIRMKSDVRVVGDGETTILKPTGNTQKGLDMFYFNDYREKGQANYLSNCIFENFKIDATNTSTQEYKTAGKGFMLNLIRNCHWKNIIIKNTDGTGIGVDCPIACSIVNCIATGCGKACPDSQLNGASGIGIGFGYSNQESMVITGCRADNNKNWGIFYEHQKRFSSSASLYKAISNKGLIISDCTASENHQNFGANCGVNVTIENCVSQQARTDGLALINTELSQIVGCKSNNETGASFLVLSDRSDIATKDNAIVSCMSKYSGGGIQIAQTGQGGALTRISVIGNSIFAVKRTALITGGTVDNLMVSANMSDKQSNSLQATGSNHISKSNSWDK